MKTRIDQKKESASKKLEALRAREREILEKELAALEEEAKEIAEAKKNAEATTSPPTQPRLLHKTEEKNGRRESQTDEAFRKKIAKKLKALTPKKLSGVRKSISRSIGYWAAIRDKSKGCPMDYRSCYVTLLNSIRNTLGLSIEDITLRYDHTNGHAYIEPFRKFEIIQEILNKKSKSLQHGDNEEIEKTVENKPHNEEEIAGNHLSNQAKKKKTTKKRRRNDVDDNDDDVIQITSSKSKKIAKTAVVSSPSSSPQTSLSKHKRVDNDNDKTESDNDDEIKNSIKQSASPKTSLGKRGKRKRVDSDDDKTESDNDDETENSLKQSVTSSSSSGHKISPRKKQRRLQKIDNDTSDTSMPASPLPPLPPPSPPPPEGQAEKRADEKKEDDAQEDDANPPQSPVPLEPSSSLSFLLPVDNSEALAEKEDKAKEEKIKQEAQAAVVDAEAKRIQQIKAVAQQEAERHFDNRHDIFHPKKEAEKKYADEKDRKIYCESYEETEINLNKAVERLQTLLSPWVNLSLNEIQGKLKAELKTCDEKYLPKLVQAEMTDLSDAPKKIQHRFAEERIYDEFGEYIKIETRVKTVTNEIIQGYKGRCPEQYKIVIDPLTKQEGDKLFAIEKAAKEAAVEMVQTFIPTVWEDSKAMNAAIEKEVKAASVKPEDEPYRYCYRMVLQQSISQERKAKAQELERAKKEADAKKQEIEERLRKLEAAEQAAEARRQELEARAKKQEHEQDAQERKHEEEGAKEELGNVFLRLNKANKIAPEKWLQKYPTMISNFSNRSPVFKSWLTRNAPHQSNLLCEVPKQVRRFLLVVPDSMPVTRSINLWISDRVDATRKQLEKCESFYPEIYDDLLSQALKSEAKLLRNAEEQAEKDGKEILNKVLLDSTIDQMQLISDQLKNVDASFQDHPYYPNYQTVLKMFVKQHFAEAKAGEAAAKKILATLPSGTNAEDHLRIELLKQKTTAGESAVGSIYFRKGFMDIGTCFIAQKAQEAKAAEAKRQHDAELKRKEAMSELIAHAEMEDERIALEKKQIEREMVVAAVVNKIFELPDLTLQNIEQKSDEILKKELENNDSEYRDILKLDVKTEIKWELGVCQVVDNQLQTEAVINGSVTLATVNTRLECVRKAVMNNFRGICKTRYEKQVNKILETKRTELLAAAEREDGRKRDSDQEKCLSISKIAGETDALLMRTLPASEEINQKLAKAFQSELKLEPQLSGRATCFEQYVAAFHKKRSAKELATIDAAKKFGIEWYCDHPQQSMTSEELSSHAKAYAPDEECFMKFAQEAKNIVNEIDQTAEKQSRECAKKENAKELSRDEVEVKFTESFKDLGAIQKARDRFSAKWDVMFLETKKEIVREEEQQKKLNEAQTAGREAGRVSVWDDMLTLKQTERDAGPCADVYRQAYREAKLEEEKIKDELRDVACKEGEACALADEVPAQFSLDAKRLIQQTEKADVQKKRKDFYTALRQKTFTDVSQERKQAESEARQQACELFKVSLMTPGCKVEDVAKAIEEIQQQWKEKAEIQKLKRKAFDLEFTKGREIAKGLASKAKEMSVELVKKLVLTLSDHAELKEKNMVWFIDLEKAVLHESAAPEFKKDLSEDQKKYEDFYVQQIAAHTFDAIGPAVMQHKKKEQSEAKKAGEKDGEQAGWEGKECPSTAQLAKYTLYQKDYLGSFNANRDKAKSGRSGVKAIAKLLSLLPDDKRIEHLNSEIRQLCERKLDDSLIAMVNEKIEQQELPAIRKVESDAKESVARSKRPTNEVEQKKLIGDLSKAYEGPYPECFKIAVKEALTSNANFVFHPSLPPLPPIPNTTRSEKTAAKKSSGNRALDTLLTEGVSFTSRDHSHKTSSNKAAKNDEKKKSATRRSTTTSSSTSTTASLRSTLKQSGQKAASNAVPTLSKDIDMPPTGGKKPPLQFVFGKQVIKRRDDSSKLLCNLNMSYAAIVQLSEAVQKAWDGFECDTKGNLHARAVIAPVEGKLQYCLQLYSDNQEDNEELFYSDEWYKFLDANEATLTAALSSYQPTVTATTDETSAFLVLVLSSLKKSETDVLYLCHESDEVNDEVITTVKKLKNTINCVEDFEKDLFFCFKSAGPLPSNVAFLTIVDEAIAQENLSLTSDFKDCPRLPQELFVPVRHVLPAEVITILQRMPRQGDMRIIDMLLERLEEINEAVLSSTSAAAAAAAPIRGTLAPFFHPNSSLQRARQVHHQVHSIQQNCIADYFHPSQKLSS